MIHTFVYGSLKIVFAALFTLELSMSKGKNLQYKREIQRQHCDTLFSFAQEL